MTFIKKNIDRNTNDELQRCIGRFDMAITNEREKRGWSQKELARQLGRADSTLCDIGKGKVTQTSVNVICDFFGWDRCIYFPDHLFIWLGGGYLTDEKKDISAEIVEAPIEPIELELEIPPFEEVETETTINKNDELVTKGMLKDYIRDLLMSFLDKLYE